MNAIIQLEPIRSAATLTIEQPVQRPTSASVSKTETDSVLQYIRAMRRLGHKRISTLGIASAMDLPLAKVRAAVLELKDQGVKNL